MRFARTMMPFFYFEFNIIFQFSNFSEVTQEGIFKKLKFRI